MIPLRCWSAWTLLSVLGALPDEALAQTRWGLVTPSLPVSGTTVATYDPVVGRTLVVNLSSNTTWSVSSITGVWTQLTQATGGPGWISDTALAYDPVRQRAVLFGGLDASGSPIANTWELAGSAWQQPSGVGSPPARHNAGMCFDAAAGVVRLVAGDAAAFGSSPLQLADVWTFDGLQWTQLPASAVGPLGPTAMAYDTERARCVALAANGTFEWQGGGFAAIATTSLPPPRRSTALVYDAFRERIVLFGGRNPGATTRGDVWEYDGSDWTQRQPLGQIPRRHLHAMVYDPALAAVRLFGGVETIVTLGGIVTTSYIWGDELRYESASPPIVQVFAQGCYFPMTLVPSGMPWLGDNFTLSMQAAGTGLPVLMVFGGSSEQFGSTPLPLPITFLGFPNCELLVSPDVVVAATMSGSSASVTVAIPNQPQLLGARLHVQAFEPGPVGNGTGSHGLLFQVGGR